MLIFPPVKLWAMRALANHVMLPLLLPAFVRYSGDAATVFMMHRFADPELGNDGHEAAALRENLEYLRTEGFEMVSVAEIVRRIAEGESIQRCVAFTVDDGYLDFATIAAPIFAAYDCPVTVFLPTGFLDRADWLWWDKFRYLVAKTKRTELRLRLGEHPHTYALGTRRAREMAQVRFERWGRGASPEEMDAAIRAVSLSLDVPLPRAVPAMFQPMSWDDCRRLGAHGITFGPHTVTHPVLATLSDERARDEISASWRRVNEEIEEPVPLFAYPYGIATSFGAREMAECERLGLSAAFSAINGAARGDLIADSATRFDLPRYGYEESQARFRLCVTGVERVKESMRALVSPVSNRRAVSRTPSPGRTALELLR